MEEGKNIFGCDQFVEGGGGLGELMGRLFYFLLFFMVYLFVNIYSFFLVFAELDYTAYFISTMKRHHESECFNQVVFRNLYATKVTIRLII